MPASRPHVAPALKHLALAATLCLGLHGAASAQAVLNGTAFTVQELVGVGRLPASLRDSHGETFGSISGLWADTSTWARVGNTYTGTLFGVA